MNTQKKAKPKRLLSLLLAVVMLLGVLPLSAVSASATEAEQSGAAAMLAAANGLNEDLPTWNTNPTWELIKSVFFQDTRLYLLREWLGSNTSSTQERYIRLEADIDVSEDYLKDKIVANGKKVLDLNGHKISIKLGKGAGYSGRQTAITVNSGATLMVIDSKGGGKIHGDSWICAPEDLDYERASTDLFYNKGTLIINVPNGEIETGRSKKQWVTAASEDGVKETIAYTRYSGYIRGQSNGAAIIGAEKSTTVIVSGRVIGRGFYKFGQSPWGNSTNTPYRRCTAVRTDGTFIMYGGEIYGMGGANTLYTSYKSDVMIYSGYFRTTTIDRMAIEADEQDDLTSDHANFTKKCEYGSFGLSGNDIAPDAEFFYGKHDATVRPKSVTDTTSDSITLSHNYGANIIVPQTQSMWNVYAYYTPYYSETARNYVGNGGQYKDFPYGYDYKLSTNWKARAEFTVLDSKGNVVGYGNERNWVRDEPNRSVFRCDVLACKEKDGSAISWISAETYTLRCKITESWGGDPEQKRTVYQDLMFSIWDQETLQAAKSMDFEFMPTTTAEGDPTSFLVTLKESCFDTAKANFFTMMDVRYSYYEPKTNNKGEVTGYEKKTETAATYADIIRKSGLYGDNTWYLGKETVLKPKAAGPLEVFIDIYDSNGNFVDTKNYKIFAMPALTGRFLGNEKYAVPKDGTMKALYSSWDARMNAGMADFAALTDYSVSTSSIIWQYCALGGQFEDIRSGDAGISFEENKNILVSNRTGYYRASYQFQGARYYSPRTILLLATDYDSNYQPYITSQGSGYEEFGENASITVNLNSDANWNVRDYTLFCRSYPAGARLRNTQVTKTTNQFTLERDFLYRNVTKETFVPGSYVFEAKVRHANGTATSLRFRITYDVTSTGFTFTVNDDKAERLSTGDGKYRTLPVDDGIFKVGYVPYPANASLQQYPDSQYNYTYVNLTPDIISLANDGTASILAPGDAKIKLKISGKSNGEVVASPTLTVSVPVVGFEVEEPNYNDYLGDYWSNVKATVKSVWGPGGRKITTGADQYVSVNLRATQGTGIGGKVKYDDIGSIVWNVQTKTGYQFPMEVIGTYYKDNGDVQLTCRADVTKIQTNAFTDTVKTACEHGAYGTVISGEYYVYTVGGTDGDPTSAIFTMNSKNAHVKNPNVQYIDVVSISTGTPAVGDPRYEGTDSTNYYDEYMKVDLGSLSGLLRADRSHVVTAQTWVSKLDSINGSGKPYDDASVDNSIEYTDVWNYSGGNILTGTPNPPTKKYEAGIYKNSLKLRIFGTDASGEQYRFAPAVKLFVNGHLIEFANTTYSTRDICYLNADYYFDVGNVTQYNSATVDATDITPTVGTKPKGIDSVSVEETDDIEVTKLLWFVDVNGNGKYDSGEEASAENGNLNSDGTFMANKKYSVDIAVGVADGAEGRLADPFSLKLKHDYSLGSVRGTSEKSVSSLDPSGVFTFPYNYITQVDETVTVPADGKYTKSTQLIYQSDAAATAKGYRLSSTFAYKNVDGSEVSETELIPGKQYRYDVTLEHGNDKSWFAPPLMNVKLDGVMLSNAASTTGSWYEAWSNKMTIHYFFTVPSLGYTVYGAATSFGGQTDDVTIQLIESGASEAAYEAVVQGNSIGYFIENVAPGTYTMKVMKQNHVTREYTVTVGTEYVKQDVKIHLKGDINGDGKLTNIDVARANAHVRGNTVLSGYELKCADVVGTDGKVTNIDVAKINAHVKGTNKLW